MEDWEQSRTERELRATTSRQRQRRKAVAAAWTHTGFLGSVINKSTKSDLVSSEPRDMFINNLHHRGDPVSLP